MAAHPVVDREWQTLIAGKPAEASAGYSVENPSLGNELAVVPDCGPEEVDRAVRAAQVAQRAWGRRTPRERATLLRRLGDLLIEHREELAVLDTLDGGSPLRVMRADVDAGVELINIFADHAVDLGGRTLPVSANLHFTTNQPYGVVARIGAFNHPFFFAASKVAAPLIAGNAVILKAPDQAPLSSLRLAELCAEVLPQDLVITISGRGAVAGAAIVQHPLIRRIGFIGSAGTGRGIQRDAAASGVKHVSLELGGKNAQIVLADADPAAAAQGAVVGMNFTATAGQSCGSTSRLLLHEAIADDVLERVGALVDAIRVGDPMDDASDMGPLVSRAQYEKVLHYIGVGLEQGGTLVSGGGRPPTVGDDGWYVAPTVIADVPPDSTLGQEEVFGPVLSVMTFTDPAEALAVANGVEYGLTASIWSNDITTALRMARDVEAGHVLVNSPSRHFWGLPFGGTKSSGVGREESLEELMSYTEIKATTVVI